MDNAKEVIDKKGARFWSEALGRPLSTVRSWRDRGIPARVLLDDTAAVRALKRAGYKRGGE